MGDGGKLGQRRGADPLRGRIRGDALRVRLLKGNQFVEEGVVLGVGYFRRVEHVVAVIVVVELGAQRIQASLNVVAHANLPHSVQRCPTGEARGPAAVAFGSQRTEGLAVSV